MRVNAPVTERNFTATDIEILEECPWCGSPKSEQWGEDPELFNTVECLACGLVYVNHRLSPEAQEQYYKNYYSEEHQASPEAKMRNKMYDLEFDFIYQHIKKGKVLDIGCSGGEFLDYFAERGFDCYGVEVSGESLTMAQQKFGENVKSSMNESESDGPFDLIVLRGTIEHIPNARDILNQAVTLLNRRKKSLIYITSTPNVNCICAQVFRTRWTQHLPEEHILHFGKKHFDEFFAGHKMSCLVSHYFYEETPYANVEEDILKVAEAIERQRQNQPIDFKSPPFYGNMMSLVYCLDSKQ